MQYSAYKNTRRADRGTSPHAGITTCRSRTTAPLRLATAFALALLMAPHEGKLQLQFSAIEGHPGASPVRTSVLDGMIPLRNTWIASSRFSGIIDAFCPGCLLFPRGRPIGRTLRKLCHLILSNETNRESCIAHVQATPIQMPMRRCHLRACVFFYTRPARVDTRGVSFPQA